MTEPTNADVLDAVTLELSRFTRDVVAEMHRLRDELAAERQRTDQLESTVSSLTASLRKFDSQAAHIVDHITQLSADVDRRLDNVEQRESRPSATTSPATATAATSVVPEPVVAAVVTGPSPVREAPVDVEAGVEEPIQFAPLMLTLDPVEPQSSHDSSIDDLVARVVGAIDPTAAPTLDGDEANSHVEPPSPHDRNT